NRLWWPALRWDSNMGFQPFSSNIIAENRNNYVSVKQIQLNNLQWFGFNYFYQPQLSENELNIIREGSVVIISAEKGEKGTVSGTVKEYTNEVIQGATI